MDRAAVERALSDGVSLAVEVRAQGSAATLPEWIQTVLASAPGIEGSVSLGRVVDVRHDSTGRGPVEMNTIVEVTDELLPAPSCQLGEHARATVGAQEAVGIDVLAGSLSLITSGDRIGLRGPLFRPPPDVGELLTGFVRQCQDPLQRPGTVRIIFIADGIGSLLRFEDIATRVLAPLDLQISVRSDTDLALLQLSLEASSARQALVGARVAAVASFMVAVLVGAVAAVLRRGDLGRRRALGASRPVLVLLVFGECGVAAALSVCISAVILMGIQLRFGFWLDLTWLGPSAALAVQAAVLSQVPSMLVALAADPLRAVRVP